MALSMRTRGASSCSTAVPPDSRSRLVGICCRPPGGHIISRDLATALSSDSDNARHAKRLPAESLRNVTIAAVNPVAGPPIYRISKDGSLRLAAPYPASYPEQAEAAATSKGHPTNYGL